MSLFNSTPLWTALVTPMDESGAVHESDLIRLIHEQNASQNGIVLLGSTGEALNLSLTERKRVVEIASGFAESSKLVVGVGGHELEGTLEWVSWLETQKIDGYLMVTPLYSKPGEEGQFHWFKTLLDAVKRPCMLYNVPSRTAVSLNENSVSRLSNHTNFFAIKESSGSVERMILYRDSACIQSILCGDDPLMGEFSLNGACGLVSVASNVWPLETKAYVLLALQHRLDLLDINLWKQASNALFTASNPIPVKALLADEARISTASVRLPLHKDDYTKLAELKIWTAKIRLWYENCRYSGRLNEFEHLNLGNAS
jgi:4-hydroxy-tetrahydrodipicolinate synthase